MVWAVLKFAWHWATKVFFVGGAILGIAGAPDDFKVWSKWIDAVLNDPLVTSLAEQAVAVANFVNQPWVRVTLATTGTLALLWPLKSFWRIRHRLVFVWRKAVSNEVWIDRNAAVALISNSAWALSRRRRSEQPKSLFQLTQLSYGSDPAKIEKHKMFRGWCELALGEFKNMNEEGCRPGGNKWEYEEGMLRGWLDNRYDNDLVGEFGEPS